VLLSVPADGIRRFLEPRGLALLPFPQTKRGSHLVWIDLGRIVSGAAQASGIDQHTWWGRTGEAMGGSIGWAMGASIGWFMGGPKGAAALAERGAKAGANMAEEVARELSRGASEVLGSYLESIVAIPNVVVEGGKRGPYLFVLGMHTNGPVAVWGDRTLRYGYGKRLLDLAANGFESYVVREPSGARLLTLELTLPDGSSWRRPTELVGLERVQSVLSQPLLGELDGDQFALSHLERSYPTGVECVTPASGHIEVASAFANGFPGGTYEIEGIAPTRPWGAFSAKRIPTRVTYPEHRRRAEL
jgi:hypothetical protein